MTAFAAQTPDKRPAVTIDPADLTRWLREPQLALWPDTLTIDELMRQAAARIDALEAAGREMAKVHAYLIEEARS